MNTAKQLRLQTSIDSIRKAKNWLGDACDNTLTDKEIKLANDAYAKMCHAVLLLIELKGDK